MTHQQLEDLLRQHSQYAKTQGFNVKHESQPNVIVLDKLSENTYGVKKLMEGKNGKTNN